jgi:hypothetical protein
MKPYRKSFGIWVPDRSLTDNRGFISPGVVGAVAGSRRRVVASDYSSAILADSPWLYWRLGETTGTTAADTSGNSRTGTYTGTATTSYTLNQSSLITGTNPSCAFDIASGVHGYVEGPSSLDLSASDYTVEFWVNLATTATSFAGLYSKGKAGGSNNDFSLQRDATGTRGLLFHGITSLEITNFWGTLAGGGTKHVVILYTNATKSVGIYINNVSFFSGTHTANPGYATDRLIRIGSARDPLTATGTYDEFALYTTRLSAARVEAHYNAGIA